MADARDHPGRSPPGPDMFFAHLHSPWERRSERERERLQRVVICPKAPHHRLPTLLGRHRHHPL